MNAIASSRRVGSGVVVWACSWSVSMGFTMQRSGLHNIPDAGDPLGRRG